MSSIITQLNVSNIKRISAVQVTPEGELVVVGGKNGNGKSSTLDSIAMALGGKALIPEKPIRRGETEACIEVTIGTREREAELTVKRKFKGPGDGTVKSTSLEVSEKRNGRTAVLKGQQAVLDAMVGTMAFDPLAFARMKPAQQVEQLKALVGVDTDELDAAYQQHFEQRTDVNRRLKEAQSIADAAESFPETEPVVVSDLVNDLTAARSHNAGQSNLEREAAAAWKRVSVTREDSLRRRADVARLERQLADAREEAERAASAVKDAESVAADTDGRLAAFVPIDTTDLERRILEADTINDHVRKNREAERLRETADMLRRGSEELTAKLDEIKQQRRELMSSAKWPVEGLSFTENGVEFNGLPFEQASSAERLRVSVAMGFAANPELKVLMIRDGSLLDEDSLRLVADMAREAGGQLWVERVSVGDECTVVITDGEVSGSHVEPELAMAN